MRFDRESLFRSRDYDIFGGGSPDVPQHPTITAPTVAQAPSISAPSVVSAPIMTTPQLATQQINAPNVTGGNDLYNQALKFYQQNYPNLINAQSNALANANNPNYYAKFQPTSFENALANQYFQNIWPNEQAAIMNRLSQSGMAYSPTAAATEALAYGNLGTQVGSYLSDLGNQRATGAINAGLGISPQSLLNPYTQMGAQQANLGNYYNYASQLGTAQQGNLQAQLSQQTQLQNVQNQLQQANLGSFYGFDTQLQNVQNQLNQANLQAAYNYDTSAQNAGINYNNALANYNQQIQRQGAFGRGIGGLAGTALAVGAAPFTAGASLAYLPMAAGMGSQLGGMIGGGGNKISDIGSIAQTMGPDSQIGSLFGGIGNNLFGQLQTRGQLSRFGGGTSNAWNTMGMGGQAQSVYGLNPSNASMNPSSMMSMAG